MHRKPAWPCNWSCQVAKTAAARPGQSLAATGRGWTLAEVTRLAGVMG